MRTTVAAIAVAVLAASGWAAYLARPSQATPVHLASHARAGAARPAPGAHLQRRQAAAPAARPVVYDCAGKPRVRPAAYLLACADGGIQLTGITWSSWSARGARGTGRLGVNDCKPTCAQGTIHYTRAAITLAGARSGPGREHFTQLRIGSPSVLPALATWTLLKQGPRT